MLIIGILAPVFVLVFLGYVLNTINFMDAGFFKNCARFTYWVALPVLLFSKISSAKFVFTASWKISTAMICSSILMVLVAWGVTSLLKLENRLKKTFIQTSFHSNTAFVGLPVIMYVASGGLATSEFIDAASMALAPMIPVINIMSTTIMGDRKDNGRNTMYALFNNIYKNPLVIACAIGLVFNLLNIELPDAFSRSIKALGAAALPLALLSIGASLKFEFKKNNLSLVILSSCFNVIILPIAGILFCEILGLTTGETLVALIFLACPTASSSYIYAQHLKGDVPFASSVIVMSTLISTFSLLIVLYLWGG